MRPISDLQSVFSAQVLDAEASGTKQDDCAIGIVTDNKDPKKLGRVKVKIPVLHADQTTFWCPIVMLGAGKNRGWFFIPEIEDEVLIAFEQGDMQRPVVVGALWGGKDKPPDKNPGGNPRRTIKSRQGSKIIFDDEKNKLIIEDGTGHGRITFEADTNKIIIEALKGDVCFQVPDGEMQIMAKEAEFKAKTNVEMHAGKNMSMGSDSKVTVNGGSAMTMSGSKDNKNCGNAQMPQAPQPEPKDVEDPYGS